MKTRLLVYLFLEISITGCATITTQEGMRELPSQQWGVTHVNNQWQNSFNNVLERMRLCQSFKTPHASLEATGTLRDEVKTATISLVSYIGTMDPHYLILVDITPDGNGTLIKAGVSKGQIEGYVERLAYWADGGQECKR